jgi:peptidoglycan hydrolase-like protein with peptidoglycan-binding domain
MTTIAAVRRRGQYDDMRRTSARAVLESPDYTLVTAAQGDVEQSIRLNASARWSSMTTMRNAATGTVTTIKLTAGVLTDVGTTLYTVDLRPVVVATGAVPAFRDLRQGDSGADVVQLQRMLNHLGFPAGSEDGKFDSTVASAVSKWQRRIGITPDGAVRRGDVIYVPQLPARLALSSDVAVGTHLAGGEPALQVLGQTPGFKIDLPENQSRLVSVGMTVEIQAGTGQWKAKVAQVVADDKGAKAAQLL